MNSIMNWKKLRWLERQESNGMFSAIDHVTPDTLNVEEYVLLGASFEADVQR